MHSDLATARRHLEAAFDCLSGDEEFSSAARDAISMLIDSILAIEHRPCTAKILTFPVVHKSLIGERKRSVNNGR